MLEVRGGNERVPLHREPKDGEGRKPGNQYTIGSRPAYLTGQIFKMACTCLFFTDFMGILRIRTTMKGVLKEKWAREVSFH